MLQLKITPPDQPTTVQQVGESLVVGRGETCDLALNDPFMSRRHARFYRTRGVLWVEDLGSSNGTVVNGSRLGAPHELRDGDVVRLSNTEIVVATAVAEPEPAVAERPAATMLRPLGDLLPGGLVPSGEEGGGDALRRYSSRLALLNEVHAALASSVELGELLDLVLDRVFEHLQPEEARVLLRDPGGEVRVVASRGSGGGVISRTLVREVVERSQAALVVDTHVDERFVQAESVRLAPPRSLLAAPLADREGALGMIALSSPLRRRPFDEEDLGVLASLASAAALRVRNLALTEAARERERLETELGIARRLQVSVLPRELPALAGWELHGANEASRVVSGDYYQVSLRDRGHEAVVTVADVCGKGMVAALLTATLEAVVSALAEAGEDLASICSKSNAFLYRRTPPDKYATAFLASARDDGEVLRCVNAGHVTPLLLRSGGGEEEAIEATGFPLGLVPEGDYEVRDVRMAPGDLLVLFTDGIIEAEDASGEEFGVARLEEICRQHSDEPLPSIAAAVDEALDRFVGDVPMYDDRTLVLVRRRG